MEAGRREEGRNPHRPPNGAPTLDPIPNQEAEAFDRAAADYVRALRLVRAANPDRELDNEIAYRAGFKAGWLARMRLAIEREG